MSIMTVFGDYAVYYNLLYEDKDYAAESAFVLGLLKKYGKMPKSLLDLGCGTGRHDIHLAANGIAVTGLDISETMLEMGRREIFAVQSGSGPELVHGDARNARLGRKYDAVISLFHVLSYQNSEHDAIALMQTALEHLNDGGLFMADFWYGPGVLAIGPEKRVKTMKNGIALVKRKATPEMDINRDLVTVHYDISLKNLETGEKRNFSEDHVMRYWFMPELRYLAEQSGFETVAFGTWLEDSSPTCNDWAAWMMFRKKCIIRT